MSEYPLTWITDHIAVGHAPMSYAELDSIKEQGIKGIVNLCGEFSDLHEIEENSGFEVFYIPIPDETAPSMEEMEKGLEWVDEAVYLGKRVLIHCKHGIGRTGTFVTAYMLRRGFNLKKAGKLLKKTRANPTNYSQWWLLRKFGKKEGQLKIGEATPANRSNSDLGQFYDRYESLLDKVDELTANMPRQDDEFSDSCKHNFTLEPIEAIYLNNSINIGLSAEQRNQVIEEAAENGAGKTGQHNDISAKTCPLYKEDRCLLHRHRPIHCRLRNIDVESEELTELKEELLQLSNDIFKHIFGQDMGRTFPDVKREDAISGKFIQKYFQYLASQKQS